MDKSELSLIEVQEQEILKAGDQDLKKVVQAAKIRLESASKETRKYKVRDLKDVTKVDFSKKPNFLI